MAYKLAGSNLVFKASDVSVVAFDWIISEGANNTIYLTPTVGAAPSQGNNIIYGVNNYNLLQYFSSPKGIRVDASVGKVQNGYGGVDIFSGITGFQGSNFSDFFQGSERDEVFYTGGGSDTVIGGGGYDRVTYYNAISTDYDISFNKVSNTYTVKPKNASDLERDVYVDVDVIEFSDKLIVNQNSLGFASTARVVGSWQPISSSVYSSTYHPGLVLFYRPVIFGLASREGFVAFGWAFDKDSGFDNKSTSVTQVNSLLIEQLSNGDLSVANDRFLSSSVTNGGNSIIVADFNHDLKQDIVLMAHNESPFVATSSTAYLTNSAGTFDVVKIPDLVMAHDAELIHSVAVNSTPAIVIKSFGATDNSYQFSKGVFSVVTQPTSKNVGGMSIAIADLNGDGSLEAVVGDVTLGSDAPNGKDKFYIGIYGYGNNDLESTTPKKILIPYFTSRSEYSEISSEWGKGVTHSYRVWLDDFNQDGKPDILAGTSMWKQGSATFPSKLQMFQNSGDLNFSDVTDVLNKTFSTNSEEVDYNLQIRDIDGSGINSYISSGLLWGLLTERDQNFILLNDGTGNLYIYKHAEFKTYFSDAKIFALQEGYNYLGPGKFNAYLNLENKISFLLDSDISTDSSSKRLLIQLPLNLCPTDDFTQSIMVVDRNQSKNIRTWAGNDSFRDINANTLPAHIDGGLGIDTSIYSGSVKDYAISKTSTGWTVSSAAKVIDTLVNVERLKFVDTAIALDTSGVGGQAYRVYKAAFNRTPDVGGLGFWISGMDGGLSLNAVAQGFVNSAEFKTVYGTSPTNAQIVTRFYDNVLGRAAESGGYNYWLGVLNSGQGSVAGVLAAFSESPENQAAVIGVIGNGILYTPYG